MIKIGFGTVTVEGLAGGASSVYDYYMDQEKYNSILRRIEAAEAKRERKAAKFKLQMRRTKFGLLQQDLRVFASAMTGKSANEIADYLNNKKRKSRSEQVKIYSTKFIQP